MIHCLLVLTIIIPDCKPYFPTCKDKTKSLLRQISSSFFAHSSFILLPYVSKDFMDFDFDYKESPLRFHPSNHSIPLKRRALVIIQTSPRRRSNEPSLERQRALDQLVESNERFSQSIHAMQKILMQSPLPALKQLSANLSSWGSRFTAMLSKKPEFIGNFQYVGLASPSLIASLFISRRKPSS